MKSLMLATRITPIVLICLLAGCQTSRETWVQSSHPEDDVSSSDLGFSTTTRLPNVPTQHVQPVALGGSNHDDNLVTTSGVHNAMKAQYTLEELGWELHSPGDLDDWGGLMRWAVTYCDDNPQLLDTYHPAGSIRPWHDAALKLL